MTAPIPPGKRREIAKPVDLEAEGKAELEEEAYGTGGRKLRKGLAATGKVFGGTAGVPDSSLGSKVASRVKSFLKRTQGK